MVREMQDGEGIRITVFLITGVCAVYLKSIADKDQVTYIHAHSQHTVTFSQAIATGVEVELSCCLIDIAPLLLVN